MQYEVSVYKEPSNAALDALLLLPVSVHRVVFVSVYIFGKFFCKFFPLPFSFNVRSSARLINDLKEITFEKDMKFASFDTSNMYTNIQTNELSAISEVLHSHNNIDKAILSELNQLCNTVLAQNYFQFNNSYYVQKTGLAMGAPTSSIFSAIYAGCFTTLGHNCRR